jgi:flavin reductase (DIM6/NTAB) family NADH-FMN oxidoreductase RutF
VSTIGLAADQTVPQFDGTVFRRVIGSFMSGVVVITTRADDGTPHGMTVSAVSSLSLDPPMLLVCLHSASGTQEAVRKSGRFAVNILAEDQGWLAERFAKPAANKVDGVAVRTGQTGVPLLEGALAVVECEVAEAVAGGTHRSSWGRSDTPRPPRGHRWPTSGGSSASSRSPRTPKPTNGCGNSC